MIETATSLTNDDPYKLLPDRLGLAKSFPLDGCIFMALREKMFFPAVGSFSAAAAGPLLMLGAALLFAVMDGLIKMIDSSFRIWDIAFYRFGCGLVFLIAVFGRYGNPFRGHNHKLLVTRGIVGSMAFLCLVTAVRLIPISVALVIFYSFPTFAALFSVLFFKETISKMEVGCIFCALSGVTILLDFTLHGALLGQTASLLGAAFAGLATSIIKKLREDNGAVIIYLYFCLLGAAISFVPFVQHPHLPDSAVEWLMTGGIVSSSMAAQLLMNQGFRYCTSWEGGLFLTTEVIFTSILGIFFLHEAVSWHLIIGGLLILASIVVLNRGNARRISYRGIGKSAQGG